MAMDSAATLDIDGLVRAKQARALDHVALRSIFHEARSVNAFLDREIPHDLLERAVALALHGPTSANGLPVRIVFVESHEAKERLRPALSPGNVDKTMAAPVTAIVAADLRFFEHLPRTFPERGEQYKTLFGGMPLEAQRMAAWDNAVLQMGYFIIALRALGLDAGPMGGFDRPKTDAEFFPDGRFVAQYLINIGYADDTKTFPRQPRLPVSEIVRFA